MPPEITRVHLTPGWGTIPTASGPVQEHTGYRSGLLVLPPCGRATVSSHSDWTRRKWSGG